MTDWQLSQSTVDFRNQERRAANGRDENPPATAYRVRQTDCRTGWQVIDKSGRVMLTSRIKSTADKACREMNYLYYNEPGE